MPRTSGSAPPAARPGAAGADGGRQLTQGPDPPPAPRPGAGSTLRRGWDRQGGRQGAAGLALLAALAIICSPLQAQTSEELVAAGRRFLGDYRPFLERAGDDPELAARLAADLPAVVALQERSPDPAWIQVLGRVALHLVDRGGPEADVVAAVVVRLRPMLASHGEPGVGPALDELLAQERLARGLWGAAEDVLGGAIGTWERPAALLLLRADLRRKQERWVPAREDLAEVESWLEDSEGWLLCEARGIRAQLELSLGRLDLAAADLAEAEAALQRWAGLRAADDPTVAALTAATTLRRVELDLTANRPAIVAALPDPSPLAPPELVRTLGLARRASRAELALRRGEALAPHVQALDELLAGDDLPATQRLSARLALIDLHLAGGDPQATADELARAVDELAGWDGPDPPLLEAAQLAVYAVRHARQSGDRAALAEQLPGLERAWDDLLVSWRSTPTLPGGVGFLHLGARRDVLGELIEASEVLDGPAGLERGLLALLRGQAAGTLARERGVEVPDLARVRRALLGDDGVLLLYLPTLRHGHLLVIDRDTLTRHDLPAGHRLLELVPRRDGRGGAPGELARQLLPEALREQLASADHVAVWGTSWLGELVLDGLPFDDTRSLGEALPLVQLPSVPVAVQLAESWPAPRADPGAPGLALWVAPEPSAAANARWPALVPLPWDGDRARALAGPFDHALHATATAERVSAGALDGVRLLHLLCHGTFDAGAALPAGLALASTGPDDDGLLDGLAVSSPSRPYPDVVLLSVCGAARGPRRLGDDGTRHLGGAFLRGGARLVLLADGQLPYGPTLELMTALHARLASGLSPARALQRARAETGHQLGLRWFGVGHRPLFPATPSAWPAPLLVLGALLLAAGGAWRRSRRRRRRRAV